MIQDLLTWLKGQALKLIRRKSRPEGLRVSHMKWELLPFSFKIDWYVGDPSFAPTVPDERREASNPSAIGGEPSDQV